MDTIIDLGSELLVDGSTMRNPYVRLMVAAVGKKWLNGSPWFAIDLDEFSGGQRHFTEPKVLRRCGGDVSAYKRL